MRTVESIRTSPLRSTRRGLGPLIAHATVTAHGGALEVASTAGAGTLARRSVFPNT